MSIGGMSPPQRAQSASAKRARSKWRRPCEEARRLVVVERRAAEARISLAWWEMRWTRALRRGMERRKEGRVIVSKGGEMADWRSARRSGVEVGAYGMVAATSGCWAWIWGGRVEKRRPSRTPP